MADTAGSPLVKGVPKKAKNMMGDTKIILIDGSQRSGTNLLLHFLDGHPELRVLPEETGLYSEFYKPEYSAVLNDICKRRDFKEFKEATKDWWLFRAYDRFSKMGSVPPPKGTFGKSCEFKFSMENFYKRLEERLNGLETWRIDIICGQILESLWEVWSGRSDENIPIVAKNHEAGLHLGVILNDNPGMKVLHMVRNPLDLFFSQKERYTRINKWSFKLLIKEVGKYDIMKRNVRDNPESVLAIRYEDLVKDKTAALRKACSFLKIKFEPEVFERLTIGGNPWYSNTSYDPESVTKIQEGRFISRHSQRSTLSIRGYHYILKNLKSHIDYWNYTSECMPLSLYVFKRMIGVELWGGILRRYKDFIRTIYNLLFPTKKLYNVRLKPPAYIDRHKGKDFLIIASGNSVKEEAQDIREFIRRYDPIVMTANNMAWFIIPHYHSFFNRSRFCTFVKNIHKESRIILSPYYPRSLIKRYYRGDYELAMFRNKDNRTFEIKEGVISTHCRSSALINVGIAIVMGARNIYVTGLDGFLNIYKSYKEYYLDDPRGCTYEEMRDIQGQYINLIQEYLKREGKPPFVIVTKTYFKNYYKDVKEFLK